MTHEHDRQYLSKFWEAKLTTLQKDAQVLAKKRLEQREKVNTNKRKREELPSLAQPVVGNTHAPPPTQELVKQIAKILAQNQEFRVP